MRAREPPICVRWQVIRATIAVPRRAPTVAAVRRYLDAAGITDGPLFRRIHGARNHRSAPDWGTATPIGASALVLPILARLTGSSFFIIRARRGGSRGAARLQHFSIFFYMGGRRAAVTAAPSRAGRFGGIPGAAPTSAGRVAMVERRADDVLGQGSDG